MLPRRRLEASSAGERWKVHTPSKGSRGSKDAAKLAWLDRYSRSTVEPLLALEGEYQVDSIMLAFEQAIKQAVVKRNERGEGRVLRPRNALFWRWKGSHEK